MTDDRPEPRRPLEYRRAAGAHGLRAGPLPAPVGFVIGVALYLGAAGVAYLMLWISNAGLAGVLVALCGAPMSAIVAAVVMEMTFEWRYLIAGVMTAIGVTLLIGCFGIAAICGHGPG